MKKRILTAFICILILAAAFVPANASRAAAALTVGTIDGENIALRQTASTSGKLLTRLSKGDVVRILSANVNAEWYKVEYGSRTGYVNRLYVNIDASMPSYQTGYSGKVVNCNEFINVRAKNAISGKKLGTLAKGAEVEIKQAYCSANWHQIAYEGGTGYVSASYIELTAKAAEGQITALEITGGVLSPKFSPAEYGYILTATDAQVTVKAIAASGVKVSVGDTGVASAKYNIRSGNSKTIRVSVNGKVRYSIYLVRDVLTVGTWNIKRGNDTLAEQGWLIGQQQPDIMGIQEVYVNASDGRDNLLSVRTRDASYTSFAATIDYEGGGQYGIGQISCFKPESSEKFPLPSGEYEARFLQRVVYTVNGKKLSFYNTHFTYQSESIRKKQFAEVLKIMDADANPYKILTGDFNAQEPEFSQFMQNYRVVNTSDTRFYDYSYKRIEMSQIDNIIVSRSVTVLNARAIPTQYSDHYPLFAFLSLK